MKGSKRARQESALERRKSDFEKWSKTQGGERKAAIAKKDIENLESKLKGGVA